MIAPIVSAQGGLPLGFLVAGLNPHRVRNAGYRGFVELLAGQISAAVARWDDYERARARAEALAEIDRVKTAFFSNVSHEFRTPLTLMLGPLEDALTEAATLPEEHRQRLDVAHRNALTVLRLRPNSLLDFSRIESGCVWPTIGQPISPRLLPISSPRSVPRSTRQGCVSSSTPPPFQSLLMSIGKCGKR